MSILTSVPTSLRRPGSFHEFVLTQAGRGFTPIAFRVALVGMKSAAGTHAALTPVQVFDEVDAEDRFGVGSELSLMCRKAFAQARALGAGPEIWAVAIDEPGGGAANAETLTVAGTATESGNLVLRVAGRTITVGVSSGDAAATVAAALDAALDAMASDLPVSSGVVGAVVTATHRTKGENGGDVDYSVESSPAGITVTPAVSVAGSGTVDITLALDTLADKDYRGIAIANHKAADTADLVAHLDPMWAYNQKRWRWGFVGEPGSLATGTTLATVNDYRIVVGSCEDSPSLPGEIAAALAVAKFSKERPNYNFDGVALELYAPVAASAYTNAEVESALAGGATPLTPTADGRLMIERLVTTKTTEGGAPFADLADIGNAHTSAEIAAQVDIGYRTGFQQENLTDDVLQRIRDMVIAKLRTAESLGWIRDVDELLAEVLVEEAESPVGRVLVHAPHRVAAALHQAVFKHTMLL